jgi:hypothetical protein
VIAEMFACFDRTYFDISRSESLYMLMDAHEVLKKYENRDEKAPQDIQDILGKAFEYYKKAYPESKISKENFCPVFQSGNGFLINAEGKKTSLCSLVFSYIESIFGAESKLPKGISLFNLYKILYLESQNMSHGCGYLYFANRGAWMEDVNILVFLDEVLRNVLRKMVLLWKISDVVGGNETEFINFLEAKEEEMNRLVSYKAEIFQTYPRVPKEF